MVLCGKGRGIGLFPAAEGVRRHEEAGFRIREGNGLADKFPRISCPGEEQGAVEGEGPPCVHIDETDHLHLHGQQDAAAQEVEYPFIEHVPPDAVLWVGGIMLVLEAHSFPVVSG